MKFNIKDIGAIKSLTEYFNKRITKSQNKRFRKQVETAIKIAVKRGDTECFIPMYDYKNNIMFSREIIDAVEKELRDLNYKVNSRIFTFDISWE